MAKGNNSSVFAHDLLWRALEEMLKEQNEQDKLIDADEQIDLPWDDKQFGTGEEDPPWCYADNGFNGYQSVQEYRIHCPYRTMAFRNILRAGREISRVMLPDSHYYMWLTKDFILEALLSLKMRGYEFKNLIIWIKTSRAGKPTYGMGHWYRNGWEGLLFGTRGRPGRPAYATTQPNYLFAPKPPELIKPDGMGGYTKHSRKPQEAYDLICRNSPGPRISLFQRDTRPGFHCWGDEAIEGLSEEWNGESVAQDAELSFGVDWDAGLVSMIMNSEEIVQIRTMIELICGQMEDIPEDVFGLRDRFDRVAGVLDAVEEGNRESLLQFELAGGEQEQIEIVAETEEAEEIDPIEDVVTGVAELFSGATDLVQPVEEEVEESVEPENELESVEPATEGSEETTPISEAAPDEIPTPDHTVQPVQVEPEAILVRAYKEDKDWFYDFDENNLKIGPFKTFKAADDALTKTKIRHIGAATDAEMNKWYQQLKLKYPDLDQSKILKLMLGEVQSGKLESV